MSKYVIILNKGAINRKQMRNETLQLGGNRGDLMVFLDNNYVDCTTDDEDNLYSFETWVNEYKENADLSGSTEVISIIEDGIPIFEGEEY